MAMDPQKDDENTECEDSKSQGPLSLSAAYAMLRQARPVVKIKPNFIKELVEFENRLQSKKRKSPSIPTPPVVEETGSGASPRPLTGPTRPPQSQNDDAEH
eukprot:GABV01007013.1.p1 GENE.GABV01007013.1~~GABV01007013.1.p1  ORF type:complete len:101 (-),score=33.83 GABV01007013.1:11-313(-)